MENRKNDSSGTQLTDLSAYEFSKNKPLEKEAREVCTSALRFGDIEVECRFDADGPKLQQVITAILCREKMK